LAYLTFGYVKLLLKFMQKQKSLKAGAKPFLGRLRCGFKKGQARTCVDKSHSRLAPGRVLHPPWEYFLIVGQV
jgi:hypothetical protein